MLFNKGTRSSKFQHPHLTDSKLNSTSAWGHNTKNDPPGFFLTIDIGKVTKVTGVVIQGRYQSGDQPATHYVKTFKVETAIDDSATVAVDNGADFQGVTSMAIAAHSGTKYTAKFVTPVHARYVRIYPQTWEGWPAMRVGLIVDDDVTYHKRSAGGYCNGTAEVHRRRTRAELFEDCDKEKSCVAAFYTNEGATWKDDDTVVLGGIATATTGGCDGQKGHSSYQTYDKVDK